MTHPILEEHGTFAGHVKLGRNRPDPAKPKLHLSKYIDFDVLLPQIPSVFDRTPAGIQAPMDGNDRYGNCTAAGLAHLITLLSGGKIVPSLADVMNFYWATGTPANTPCPPGGPTDDGRDEQSCLTAWQNPGFTVMAGQVDQAQAFAFVTPSNHDHLRALLFLFGGGYMGVGLPVTAQGQSTWEVVGDPKTDPNSEPYSWGGHCAAYAPAWDGNVTKLYTWGSEMDATLAFNDTYFDEAWAVLDADWLNGGKSVDGFDAQQLASDMQQITDQQAQA